MQKRDGLFLKNVASFEIFLIVFAVFSFAFIIGDFRVVGAQQAQSVLTYASGSTVASGSGTLSAPLTLGTNTLAANTPYAWHLTEGTYTFVQGGNTFTATQASVNTALQQSGTQFVQAGSTTPQAAASSEGFISNLYSGKLFGATPGTVGSALISGLAWGATVYLGVKLITGLFGLDENLSDALSTSLGVGTFLGVGASNLIGGASGTGKFIGLTAGEGGILIGGLAAVIIFVLIYRDQTAKRVTFQCLPWEAPVGGKTCEKCNEDPFRPCSEYRCKSLGQACEIVNAGTTDEKCVWVNPNDALSPTITPWDKPLTDGHAYTNHQTRPASLGTRIVKNNAANGCIQAFTPLSFGILTNEPAQCKVDLEHKNTFDEMQFFMGNSNLFTYNHSQQMSLPSPNSLNAESPQLQNDGKYDLYIRCRDKNGNENVDEFAIQFCVDPSPDATPPVIVDTSITSGSAVRHNVGSVPLQVYVNEPATCKWSSQDKGYDLMENTMNCATSLAQINARELYTCTTNLTGIANNQENNFFFRCKDQPSKPENDRNVNINSYPFTLRGSQPLNIIFTAPNGTITGSTQTIPVELKVTTDDGADEGVAICSFSPNGAQNTFVPMFETEAVEHVQELNLGTGNYNYHFRCVDLGGNAAEAQVSFNVLVDTLPPLITRAYRDSTNNALKIVTNEDASCVYSLNSCNFNFNEGVALLQVTTSNKKNHYAEWQPNLVYYLKCKDEFGNEPAPNSCSLVASASAIA